MHTKTFRTGIALLIGTVLLSGCFGQFALVRTVYDANQSIDNKWARSVTTALLIIIPVYGLAGFADWVIVNPIEFWTKKNPITDKATVSSKNDGVPQNGTLTTLNTFGERVVVSWHYSADRTRVSAIIVTFGTGRKASVRMVRSRATIGALGSGPVSVTDVTFDKNTPLIHRSAG